MSFIHWKPTNKKVTPLNFISVKQDSSARVVGFKVEPFSVNHEFVSPSASILWDGKPAGIPPLKTCNKDDFVNPVKLTNVSYV